MLLICVFRAVGRQRPRGQCGDAQKGFPGLRIPRRLLSGCPKEACRMERRLPFWREAPAREPVPAAHLTGFYMENTGDPTPSGAVLWPRRAPWPWPRHVSDSLSCSGTKNPVSIHDFCLCASTPSTFDFPRGTASLTLSRRGDRAGPTPSPNTKGRLATRCGQAGGPSSWML